MKVTIDRRSPTSYGTFGQGWPVLADGVRVGTFHEAGSDRGYALHLAAGAPWPDCLGEEGPSDSIWSDDEGLVCATGVGEIEGWAEKSREELAEIVCDSLARAFADPARTCPRVDWEAVEGEEREPEAEEAKAEARAPELHPDMFDADG